MGADVTAHAAFASEDYDEFQFLEFHSRWAGLPWSQRPPVARDVRHVDGHAVSFLRWGAAEPELVLLHGSGQNAHTWDTFVLALDRSCIAIDLPGHGRSDWRADGDYFPEASAPTVAQVIAEAAPNARAVVGMSLGGLTALHLASLRPELVRSLVLVDITPGRPEIPAQDVAGRPMPTSLMSGPRRFPSWEDMVEATHATMPHRPREAVVPGVRHNARRLDDGSWEWRYDRMKMQGDPRPALEALWEDVSALTVDTMLVKGALSPIVSDESIAELRRRRPTVSVEVIGDAGHSVQTDQPVLLAQTVNAFLR